MDSTFKFEPIPIGPEYANCVAIPKARCNEKLRVLAVRKTPEHVSFSELCPADIVFLGGWLAKIPLLWTLITIWWVDVPTDDGEAHIRRAMSSIWIARLRKYLPISNCHVLNPFVELKRGDLISLDAGLCDIYQFGIKTGESSDRLGIFACPIIYINKLFKC